MSFKPSLTRRAEPGRQRNAELGRDVDVVEAVDRDDDGLTSSSLVRRLESGLDLDERGVIRPVDSAGVALPNAVRGIP
jgi:hypothetical protein